MKQEEPKHTIDIVLHFKHRKDFLALKNAVSRALRRAQGSYFGQPPLRRLYEEIVKQAEAQNWEDLERTFPEDDRRKKEEDEE